MYRGTSAAESFTLEIFNYKKNGYYVELGAFHSTNQSNTYFLEKDFNWSGVSFEINEDRRNEFIENRKNPCLGDAIKFNYIDYFEKNNFPEQIDFLQINIDSGYDPITGRPIGNRANAILALCALPINLYRFSVITFEHDTNMYFKNSDVRDAQRTILDNLGYSLIRCTSSEDWWVDPLAIPMVEYRKFFSIPFS